MTAVGVAVVALLVAAILVKGKTVRLGSLVVGVMVGLLIGATPVGPATAAGIASAGEWVYAKVAGL
jgi:hypothetical protein